MKIGIPKEIKDKEARVGMTPMGVAQLIKCGHSVVIESNAGLESGFNNEQYQNAGATLVSAAEAWQSNLVIKVKEPQKSEYSYLQQQIIFTFFHLAGVDKSLSEELIAKGTTALAYEALENDQGKLPILAPMSAVAGNMSVLMGAYYLAQFNQGSGMQLGTVLNKAYGKVVILGDGIVGQHAAKVASGMGANVFLASRHEERWPAFKLAGLSTVNFFQSNPENIAAQLLDADLVIGAVLSRGGKAPKIITEPMLKTMPEGSVIVDVSIDQGGCFETSKATTHSNPVYIKHGVIHYCVSNMPGAYPKASTLALTEATLSYILDIANHSLSGFMADKGKIKAVNTYKGKITSKQVAKDLDLLESFQAIDTLI